MYIIICERITSPGLMHDTGCLGLVHWDDPEGWYGGGGSGWGTHVYLWQIHVDVCQNQYNILIVISSFLIILFYFLI